MRGMLLFGVAAAIGLAGCATTPVPLQSRPIDRVTFDLTSWGRTVEQWSIGAQGGGTYVERALQTNAPHEPFVLEHHDFDVGTQGFAKLQNALLALPKPAPSYDNCKNYMTDAQYGTLRVERSPEISEVRFYYGCFDSDYKAFTDQIRAMSAMVEGWGVAQPVARTEQFNTGK